MNNLQKGAVQFRMCTIHGKEIQNFIHFVLVILRNWVVNKCIWISLKLSLLSVVF